MNIANDIEKTGIAGSDKEQTASTRRSDAPLSDSALVLLTAAANREGGAVLPPPADLKSRGGALKAVLKQLLVRELVEEMPVGSDAEVWRHDEDMGRVGLRITTEGCAAIGIATESDGAGAMLKIADDAVGTLTTPGTSAPEHSAQMVGECDGDADAAAETIRDSTIGSAPASDTLASEAEGAGAPGDDAHSAAPRPRSKQDQIITLLSREEGATIDDLMAATGWLPHTVRAVLSGLRKKGHRIDRQKDDDAGSVYRILPSAKVEAVPSATGGAV